MKQKNMWKAVLAMSVALAFVLPGSAAFANVGTIGVTSNSKTTVDIKNIIDNSNNGGNLGYTEETIVAEKTGDSPMPLAGTIRYVGGSGPGNYTTISAAITAAVAGDTIYVYNGTYNEKVIVDKRLTLIGENRDNVIVNGGGTGNVFYINTPITNVNISSFTITNGYYGIQIYKSSNNTITNCNAYKNTYYGIYLSTTSKNNVITNCNAYNNSQYGIYSYSSSNNNNITNCNAYNNNYGIYFSGSSDNIIINCNVYNNQQYGIYLTSSPNSIITNCDVYSNSQYGIYIYTSSYNKLSDNTIHDNVYNFAVEGTIITQFYQVIGPSNTVNGKPLYYFVNETNITLDGTTDNFGYLALISCKNITAMNADVSGVIIIGTTYSTISNVISHNSRNGIYLYLSSNNNSILNCNVYNNSQQGIYIRESSNNNITNCDVYSNSQYGIYLYSSAKNNNIINCKVYNNTNHGIYVYTSSSSNVIMNCLSYNNKDGIRDYSSSYSNMIMNCDAYNNSQYGIYLLSSNSNITNCNVYHNQNGIYVTSASENIVIMNCTSYNNSGNGIYLKSLNSYIINCDAYNNTGYGIYISKYKPLDNNNITNCDVYNNKMYGIYLYQSSGNNIVNCDAYGNNDYGIYLYQSLNNNLQGNTIHDNVYNFAVEGTIITQFYHVIGPSNTINGKPMYYFVNEKNITLDGTTNNFGYLALISCKNITAMNADVSGVIIIGTTHSTISNVSSHNSRIGIYLYLSSNNNSILNCNVYNNKEYGIYLYQSSNNNIIMNCSSYNNIHGIYLWVASNNNIINCNVYNNSQYGIYLYQSSNNNNITNCDAYNNDKIGIYLYQALRNNILNCDVHDNSQHGIDFSQSSNNNNITNCEIYNNKEYGIRFWVALNIKLRDNTIHDNTYNFGIEYGGIDYFYHDIDPSNTINGKPMYYLVKDKNITLDEHNNFGYLALISCTNITAKNADVYGVLVVNTTKSTISNVTSHNSAYGIYIWSGSNNNNIINCDAYNNSNCGIYLYISSNNNIENCNLYNNVYGISLNNAANNITNCASYNNVYGIYLSSSSDSNIVNCNLYSNKNGIRFYISSNNDIVNCNIFNNNEYGIYLVSISNGNSIHHNNFNNVWSAYDACTNQWDNGSAGNYWSNYTGVDVNGDGIGDTPYNITGGSNKDRYPLMVPLDETPPIITSVMATPNIQTTTDPVNITCAAIDNIRVDTVKVHVDGPGGFTLEAPMNVSMSSFWYETVYPLTGEYEYFIWANDSSGNVAVSDTYSFVIIDLETPTSAVAPLPIWKKAVPFAVTATAYDNTGVANVTLWSRYSSNGTAWTEWTAYGIDEMAPWSWSFTSSDGYYQFYSIAVDDYGNVEEAPSVADASTGIDTTKPVTTIGLTGTMGGDNWYTSVVTVALSATDALSGVESMWYQIDSGLWHFYTAPFTVSGDGTHMVRYYSFDRAGNQEVANSVSFKIDTTAPTTTHTLVGIIGSQGWYITNVTITLSANDVTSGVNYTKYKLNNGSWIIYTGSFVVTTNGNYTLYYCSVDFAGNTEATKQVAFKIQHDVLPPVTTHEFDGIMGENNWFINAVTVTLSAVDDSAGVASTKYKLDAGAWTTYTGAFLVTEDAAVHTLYYYSVDKVGNREENKSATLKIDRTKPTINLTVEKTGLNKWLLTATVSDETSGIAKVDFYVDSEFVGEDAEAPYELEYSGTGDTAQAIVYDNAGNSAISAEVKDQAAPDSQSQSSMLTLVSVSKDTIQGQSISSTLQRLFNLR